MGKGGGSLVSVCRFPILLGIYRTREIGNLNVTLLTKLTANKGNETNTYKK